MKIDLRGKKALVGGSSKGIGLGIATELANSGASVCLMARNESRLKEIVSQLPDSNNHSYLVVDFSKFEDFKIKIEEYVKNNQVDILINNTQGPPAGNSLSKNIDSYQEAFDLLFKSVVHTTSLVIPGMQKNKWGRIVFISSVVGLSGNQGQANYAASKAGLIGLAKSISKEMGSRNITSNVVAPGYIETDMTSFLDDQNKENIIEQLSIKRIGKPEDISNIVSFLCKDESEYITGQVIPVDGGLTT